METRQKPRSPRQRIKGLFKRTPQSPSTASTKPSTTVPRPPSTESQTAQSASSAPAATTRSPRTAPQTPQSTSTPSAPAHGPTTKVYGDRERTRERYKEASKLLQDAVKRHEKWGTFDFPELTGEPEGFNDSQFKDKINAVLQSRKQALKDLSGWKKCEHAVQCAFTAFSPFAKNFLTIAKEGQQIPIFNPYGLLCAGLFLLITIADKEIARKEELSSILDYMCQQLEQLAILDILPDDLEQREFVINRALDVRSAAMLFLATNIRHDSTFLGIPGKVVKVFFSGDEHITDSKMYFEKCVESYGRALSNVVGVRSILKVLEIVKGIAALNFQIEAIEDKFIVPFDRNPKLTGRNSFIQTMKEKLESEVPRQYNHRIALHGMGGIGKTQCALEYVYSSRSYYTRIYWISAADEASMLSGYEKIAKAARLPITQSATPRQIAETVKSWLRTEESWLVVVDNLDEYEVAKGLLPENAPGKHTLITTRNPKTTSIPAESLEVPLLGEEDSIDLLLTLSTVAPNPTLQQKEQARLIVEELGYLPLAVLQAAAFIREVTGNISTYLDEYHKNRRELIKWPTNDSRYPHSVATTWSMSFTVLRANFPLAARLLQLFSFLNPDGILIDFLVDGAEGLDGELQEIVSNQVEMAKVLLELEKFSLIKWNREGKSIFIHRLVQLVVNYGMTHEERDSVGNAVIDLCLRAFPDPNDNRYLCRLYEPQIVNALGLLETLRSISAMELTVNVAQLRMRDGKYSTSRDLLLQTLHISTSVLGDKSESTFQTVRLLANAYSHEGDPDTAVQMLEDLLPKVKECLGNDHIETLLAMDSLASSRLYQGRWNEAAELEEHLVGEFTWRMGADNVMTIYAENRLAEAYLYLGRFEEAIKLEEDLLARTRRLFGEGHVRMLEILHLYGITLSSMGHSEKAIQVAEEVMEKMRILLGDSHLNTVVAMWNLARMYVAHGKAAEGEALFQEAKVSMTRVPADSLSYLKSRGIG